MSENNPENKEKRIEESRRIWDEAASSFDEEPDHGLREPRVREAWTALINRWLPETSAKVLDIGCGTGSLSVVMAEQGHTVTGIDLSPAMIELARQKADQHGVSIDFQVMDAAYPQFAPRSFDVILCRHLLWALPEPEQVLLRWLDMLERPGRLVLVEGFWGTGAGLHAEEVRRMLPAAFADPRLENLTGFPVLWGRTVTDERYAIIANLK